MPGLVPCIHVFHYACNKTWMAGTSPATTMSGKNKMPFADFRQFLDVLRQHGELIDINRPVALNDVGKAMKQAYVRGGPAIMFNNNGTDYPLVAGIYSTREKALLAFEADEDTIFEKVLHGLDNPIAPVMTANGAPCHEVIIEGGAIDIRNFPVPQYSPKDGGPYITPGIVVSEDPETGVPDVGHYRFLILGKDTFSFSAQPFHRFGKNLAKCKKLGIVPKAALIIGVDPIIAYTCQVQVPDTTDDWALAGGLRGAPVELTQCKTCDVKVPATFRSRHRVRSRSQHHRARRSARRIYRLLHAAVAEAGGAHHRDHAPQAADLSGSSHRQAGH
jgi:2,5-furandicarboxylate decarboxylase 1